jgi:hypothetical protein
MRGGMNMMGLLAALVAAANTDKDFITSHPDLKTEKLSSVEKLSFVKENTPFLQEKINDGNIEIPPNFDLQSYIGEMNNKKDGTDDFEQMLVNPINFSDYQIEGDSDVKSDEGYSKEQYFEDNNIPPSSL